MEKVKNSKQLNTIILGKAGKFVSFFTILAKKWYFAGAPHEKITNFAKFQRFRPEFEGFYASAEGASEISKYFAAEQHFYASGRKRRLKCCDPRLLRLEDTPSNRWNNVILFARPRHPSTVPALD